MRVKRIKNNSIKINTIFVISTKKQFLKFIKKNYSKAFYKDIDNFFKERSYTGLQTVSRSGDCIIWIKKNSKDKMLSTAVHEISHLIDCINYNRQFDDGEVSAYFSEYYFNEFLKMIKK